MRRLCLLRDRARRVGGGQDGFTLTELLVTCAIIGLIMGATLAVHLTGMTAATVGESKAEAQQGARAAMIMEEDLRLAGFGYPAALQTTFTAASPTSVTFNADLLNASTKLSQVVNNGDTTLNVASGNSIASGDTVYLINGDQWESLSVQSATPTTVTVTTGATTSYPAGSQVGRPRVITYSWNAATNRLSKDAGDGNGLRPFADGVQGFQLQFFDTNDALIPAVNLAARLNSIRRMSISMSALSPVSPAGGAFTVHSSVRPRNL